MKNKLCEICVDATIEELREDFNDSFNKVEKVEREERYICQLIRLDGFSENGSMQISIDVPMNAKVFDSFTEAVAFGEENNGTVEVLKGFWGKEYNYADNVEIFCGYIVYSTNDEKYESYKGLPYDRSIEAEEICSPSLLVKLQEAHQNGGQTGMLEWARNNM